MRPRARRPRDLSGPASRYAAVGGGRPARAQDRPEPRLARLGPPLQPQAVSEDPRFAWFAGRRALITGGLGFIGSTLAHRLVALGARVTVVDSLIPEYGGNPFNLDTLADRVQVNVSDIRDVYSLSYLVAGQEVLFNLAGQTSHLDSMHEPLADLEINCRAQLTLLETCRSHCPGIKLVFASTRQLYGKPDYLPVDERHLLRPADVNGVNKMAGEWYHILYNNVYGLKASALRLTNTYGPRMRIKDARQTFLGVWIRLLLEDKPFEVWGGEQLRDFTYVDDAVDALLLAATVPEVEGQALNIGGFPPISLNRLAELLIGANGKGEAVLRNFPAERKRIDIGDYYADDRRFRSLTGWAPKVDLAEGLKTSLDYYRRNLPHYL
ncbi:MAG: NAD-dependent epimerase/dehydratase family protein [Proteobacteria bacterium]|nr:NAD-dependent epimerase/dehydratase family protein [Pseudomonadota bacterium]MBI3499646.1 NAD-dependent epimerase/dehydratase family protein [Pseudomonadota bacterium]